MARFAEVWSLSQRTNITPLQCVPDGDDILFLVDVKRAKLSTQTAESLQLLLLGSNNIWQQNNTANHCVCVPTCSKSDCIFTSIRYCMIERISGFDTEGSAQTSLHYCNSFIDTSSSYSSLKTGIEQVWRYGSTNLNIWDFLYHTIRNNRVFFKLE